MIPGSRFGQVMPQAERLIQTYDIAKEAVVLGGLRRAVAPCGRQAFRCEHRKRGALGDAFSLRCCTKFNTVFKGNKRMANPG